MTLTPWYKKYSFSQYFLQHSEKIVAWILAPLFIAIFFYFDGTPWKWEEINPITMPPPIRIILSAFVYLTFWAFLYFMRVYQVLYYLLPRKQFKEIKALIWIWLIAFTYFQVIPFLIWIANFVIMVWYNLFTLLLYIAPAVFFAILIWILIFIYKKYKKN